MKIDYGPTKRRPPLGSVAGQVSLAAALLLFQYILLVSFWRPALDHTGLINTTALGCFIATLFGIFLIRGVRQYPGVERTSYILPGFCVSYGALLIVYMLGRFEYSRILLTSSFVLNIALFISLHFVLWHKMKMRIGVVLEGDFTPLLEVPTVEWTVLDTPKADVSDLDAISVDLRSDISDEWERRLASFALQGLPVFHSKHLLESLTGKVNIEHISENIFGTLSPLYSYMRIKRAIDFIAAAIVLVVLLPFLLLIALLIVLDSPGPALFRQMRVGYRGRLFRVFKFRTMTSSPNEDPATALEAAKTKSDDQRITRLGAFLRRSRLDELPQLLNVIKGEMSWIGPRPEADVLSRWYEEEIPFYRYRHIVPPGITGWAQVNQGHVSEVSEVTSKLHYDFYYIKNFSPWIDVLIVMKTIRTMLTGFGAR